MGKKETIYLRKDETGTVRLTRDEKGEVRLDSYFGDVENKREHDRFSFNVTTGQVSGHDFDHKNKFDTNKAGQKGYDEHGNKKK